ncbi:hypothetical protein E3N88_37786 [Mikania micrantha]|uniref:Reverse transcriptase zinc-binding domain-containing protein n=1 Tax=Mikania micrantha TaxID=192012 RepID=A0A5N6LS63_9ASTR|nr:hypothetical protein E3N88_37786 [Mikania micrantha]
MAPLMRGGDDEIVIEVNLMVRGISLPSSSCPMCTLEDEDEDHLFFRCPVAKETWRRISWWANNDFVCQGSIHNILSSLGNDNEVGRKNKIKMVIVFATIWEIWTCRNKWAFKSTRTSMEYLLDAIKVQAFTWVTHRGRKIATVWDKWKDNPWEGVVLL